MNRPLGMGAATGVVAASILLSRLLGLARESLLATLIGVNADGDLYRQAFLLPDMLNYLLAGGFLTITLVPILSRHIENGKDIDWKRAFSSVFRFVSIGIVLLTAAAWLAADPLVSWIFPEAADHDRLVSLTRLILPAQIFFVVGALLIAVQFTHRRFLIPALAPILYNLGIIAGGLIGWALGESGPEAFLTGALAGAIVGNFGVQWYGARRVGARLVSVPKGSSSVGEYLLLALPLMIGQSIAVLDEQFIRFFGQVEEGATSALTFARQLNMVPVGVIALAAGAAAYPFLARLWAKGDVSALVETTSKALRNTLFVACGATALLIVVGPAVVRLLYQYGEFSATDGEEVVGLLTILAFSIPAWGLQSLLTRYFYAKRRMWTPVVVGTVGTVVAIPVWLGLYDQLGVEGFALASVLTMSAFAVALAAVWGADVGWAAVSAVALSLVRSLVAASVAGAVALALVNSVFGSSFTVLGALAMLAVGGSTTAATFLLMSRVLRSPELAAVGANWQRRRRRQG